MSIQKFLVHRSPSKHRIYALATDGGDHLEAVTTLAADSLQASDALVDALNLSVNFLSDDHLEAILPQLPDAVQLAVREFLRTITRPPLGDVDPEYGRIDSITTIYFFGEGDVLDFLESSYALGLGVRVSNTLRPDGEIEWVGELRTAPGSVPVGVPERRTWALPEGVPVKYSGDGREQPTDGPDLTGDSYTERAFTIAEDASEQGQWVRMHYFEDVLTADADGSTSSTSTWVVDVLDAPVPPASYHDES
jgi:hypothetical protein